MRIIFLKRFSVSLVSPIGRVMAAPAGYAVWPVPVSRIRRAQRRSCDARSSALTGLALVVSASDAFLDRQIPIKMPSRGWSSSFPLGSPSLLKAVTQAHKTSVSCRGGRLAVESVARRPPGRRRPEMAITASCPPRSSHRAGARPSQPPAPAAALRVTRQLVQPPSLHLQRAPTAGAGRVLRPVRPAEMESARLASCWSQRSSCQRHPATFIVFLPFAEQSIHI